MTEAVAAVGIPEGSRPDPLFRRLIGLTVFRIFLVTVLLGGTALVSWRASRPEEAEPVWPLYWVILATYAGSLAVAVLLRLPSRPLRLAAVAHVAFDVALAAGLTALTGRSDSVFVFMFIVAIFNGAILLHRRGALLALGLSMAAYALVVLGGGHGHRAIGTTIYVHAAAFVATAGLSAWLAEQLRSTGERLAARELDLADATALHEAIVQSVASGLLTLDPAGRVTFLNRAGEAITGLTAAQAAGRLASEVLPDFAPTDRRGETEWTNARGERLRLGFSRFGLAGDGRRDLGRAVIFQDLTQLRAMEAAVQRGERLADLGRVAAGLAHELRNPLASMSGCIELLSSSVGLRAEDQRLMSIVLKEAARLEQLVGRFLDYTRPAQPRLAEVELVQVLGEVADVFTRDPAAAQVTLSRALEPAVATCDPDQLRQVLWNLLVNAAQAVQSGGDGGGVIRLACGTDPAGAWLVVEDDGPGVAEADRAKLFTPFFTTKAGGTGLGLATVHRIVEAHGGAISVENVVPHGARFTVHLPEARAGAKG